MNVTGWGVSNGEAGRFMAGGVNVVILPSLPRLVKVFVCLRHACFIVG